MKKTTVALTVFSSLNGQHSDNVNVTLDYSYPGLFVPSYTIHTMDHSYRPWTIRTLNRSYLGLFVHTITGRFVPYGRPTKTCNVKTCNVALNNSHSVGCERARLVRTDRCSISHRFTCIKVPHKIIVMHHFLQ